MRRPPHPVEMYSCFEWPRDSDIAIPQSHFVLRTCQRFEVFAFGSEFPEQHGVVPLRVHRGWRCLERLLFLCCGGDSQILGETEIFGQIKRQYREQSLRLASPLHWLLQSAFWGAKALRNHCPLRSGPTSYGAWARKIMRNHSSALSSQDPVLMVGAGNLVHEIAHGLSSIIEPSRFLWMNRTHEKAELLAQRYGGSAVAFSPVHLAQTPFQVLGIGSPEKLNTWHSAWDLWLRERSQAGTIIDFSSPTLVSACVQDCENVWTLRHLQESARANVDARRQQQRALWNHINHWVQSHFHLDFATARASL